MANDINRVFMIGRLTRDPELRYTQGGTSIASFSLANNKSYTANGEKKEQVNFFNCIAWGKPGEVIAQHCKKGQRLGVEGRLQQRSYEKDGHKNNVVEVVVENFQFLSGNGQQARGDQSSDGGLGLEEVPADSVKGFDQQAPSHFNDEDILF